MTSQKISTAMQLMRDAEEKLATARRLMQDATGHTFEESSQSEPTTLQPTGSSNIIEGIFDGMSMIGSDKKVYPVPANYASKSKLVEGDTLKLTIVEDGSFIYKQIGPVDRKHVRGELIQDERGEYGVHVGNKEYHVLMASVTYFKGVRGDEVTLVLPKSGNATWGAIENIIKVTDERQLPELVRESMERLREGDLAEDYDPANEQKIPITETGSASGSTPGSVDTAGEKIGEKIE